MKVIISLPQELYDHAEAITKRRKISLDALYAEALKAYTQAHEDAVIIDKVNAVYTTDDTQEITASNE